VAATGAHWAGVGGGGGNGIASSGEHGEAAAGAGRLPRWPWWRGRRLGSDRVPDGGLVDKARQPLGEEDKAFAVCLLFKHCGGASGEDDATSAAAADGEGEVLAAAPAGGGAGATEAPLPCGGRAAVGVSHFGQGGRPRGRRGRRVDRARWAPRRKGRPGGGGVQVIMKKGEEGAQSQRQPRHVGMRGDGGLPVAVPPQRWAGKRPAPVAVRVSEHAGASAADLPVDIYWWQLPLPDEQPPSMAVKWTCSHAIENPEGCRRYPLLLGEVAWDNHKRLADPRSGTQESTRRVRGGCIATDADTKRMDLCAALGSRHTQCQNPSLL